MNHFRRLAGALAIATGGSWLFKGLVKTNADIEDAKNQIASILAIAKKTDVNDQLSTANELYDKLREKAAKLPGETEDYVNMLSRISQPLADAGATNDQMVKFAANGFVLAKGWGVSWQQAARDMSRFINFGTLTQQSQFSARLLHGAGMDPDAKGRAKAKAMTRQQRLALYNQQLDSPIVNSVAERLGGSFSGRLETLKDSLKLTMAKAGEALFESLKITLNKVIAWLDKNQDRIVEWASTVGYYINAAFLAFQDGIEWIGAHEDVLATILVTLGAIFVILAAKAIMAWLSVFWPALAGAAMFYGFLKLYEWLGPAGLLVAGFIAVGIAALLMWAGIDAPLFLAIVAFAAMGAAVYQWRDDILQAFHDVMDAGSDLGSMLEKIPGISNIVHTVRGVKDAINGDWGGAAYNMTQGFNPAAPIFDMATQPIRDAHRDTDAGVHKNDFIIHQTNQVTIQGGDADANKKAFDNNTEKKTGEMLRDAAAAHGLGGIL